MAQAPTLSEARRACEYLNSLKGHSYRYRIWNSLASAGDYVDRRRNGDGLCSYVTHAHVIALAMKLKRVKEGGPS